MASERAEKTISFPVIRKVSLGPWETNCYVVSEGGGHAGGECWIIDAGFEPEELVELVRKGGLKPTRLILTHAHLDHIGGVREVLKALGRMPIAIHRAEAMHLTDPTLNLSAFIGMPTTAPEADEILEEGQELTLGRLRWRVIHTPGHSPGGITLHWKSTVAGEPDMAIVGDTLIAGSIGRSDFPTSDGKALIDSIKRKLFALPEETRVYPGHGPTTTIGDEKEMNPFVGRAAGEA